ncbi:MAG: type I DNA topoisomerase [Patescibacteria group bacterium]|nr:type I DNA topoisomerase [Patescibacteria group bacterium]
MKNLVIVESPTKARTIGRFLGKDYEIIASMGHIMDLPKSTLGVDLEHNFLPDYQQMPDKKKIIAQLKTAGKTAENIVLATDPDREGEAIASHVRDVLSSNSKSEIRNPKFSRVVFHEITKEAIDEAFKTPRDIDGNLVDAQTARRVLDRLVGYKLSPILWQKVRRGLSAGRVQSVALRLIVEREKEIEKFKKEPYYTISVLLVSSKFKVQSSKSENEETQFELIEVNGQKIGTSQKLNLYDGEYGFAKTVIDTQDKAKKIEEDLKTKEFIVSGVVKKEVRRTPPPPYTTSTLQQDGARRMGLSGKRTMSLAQKLYEEGFITYHRTDSVAVSDSARKQMTDYVRAQFGAKYLPPKPRYYKVTQKNAQEAHEAIRPTKVNSQSSVINNQLGVQYGKLYDIIWTRALSSQMADAITESTVVMVDGSKGAYTLKANGSVLVFDGFLKINPLALNDNKLPDFEANEKLNFVSVASEFHETLPPPRYNDASIIKTLEEKGIGRPSTYATIISTIESRQYIERAEQRFQPTSVGFAVNDFLVDNFSSIDDIPFTAEMEDGLDQIASGERKWVSVIKDFYTPFEKTLANVKDAKRVKIEVEKTDEICPLDSGHLIIRIGRFGKFMACENFPTCKFTKPLVQETNLICPKDRGKIVFKKTKKGRRFYGCANYPKCDFASWTKPIPEHAEPRLNLGEIPNGNTHREKLEDSKDKIKKSGRGKL